MESFLYFALFFSPMVIIFGVMYLTKLQISKRSRLPFKIEDSLRPPAFSLLQKYVESVIDIFSYGFLAIVYFQMPFSFYALNSYFAPDKNQSFYLANLILLGAVFWYAFKSVKCIKKLINIRLGMEAEWAVSSAIAKIPEKGLRVFHDVQGSDFNIDHVISYSGGVIAIETKGRRKPNLKSKDNTHKLCVEGDKIVFPHHTDTKTIEQASRQAKWLSEQLSSSTGESVQVSPMVVIPGWYIERKQRPVVPVLNHKNLVKYYNVANGRTYNDAELNRINFQLEKLSLRNSDEL